MADYGTERRWADAFVDQQRLILADFFKCPVEKATEEQDTEEATDYLAGQIRIGGRVRRHEMKSKYYGQFTIRTSVGRSGLSELDKVLRGDVNYLLYGFANADSTLLDCWWLIDLRAVTTAYKDHLSCTRTPHECEGARTQFLSFDLDGFLSIPPLIVATSESTTKNNDNLCAFCRRKVEQRRGNNEIRKSA